MHRSTPPGTEPNQPLRPPPRSDAKAHLREAAVRRRGSGERAPEPLVDRVLLVQQRGTLPPRNYYYSIFSPRRGVGLHACLARLHGTAGGQFLTDLVVVPQRNGHDAERRRRGAAAPRSKGRIFCGPFAPNLPQLRTGTPERPANGGKRPRISRRYA